MDAHPNTVKKCVAILRDGNWIDVVRVGSERGGVNAYVVNRRVAWADKRENQQYAIFDARIITSTSEQDRDVMAFQEPLNQLPNFGEFQIPMGDGLPPPNQPTIEGLEPDLPAIGKSKAADDAVRDRLEADGQQRLID
jgi:hypothetical protein